ncbi:MAG: hypothetical protein IAF94_04060 [Pirellulaceae bacterium]|nr:hypothetical protein [Pirellulaceae bacterium]
MDALPKPLWYQFSLRTLLVFMTLLCLGPGSYVAYEQQTAREQQRAAKALVKLGCVFSIDETAAPRSAAMRLILGDESFRNVKGIAFSSLVDPEPYLADFGLRHLRSFPHLKTLDFSACNQFTDADLEEISELSRLQYLDLNFTHLSDAGMVHFAGLTKLKGLSLDRTEVSDAGLAHLTGLTQLEYLYVSKTQVTQDGVNRLQMALPHCRIRH